MCRKECGLPGYHSTYDRIIAYHRRNCAAASAGLAHRCAAGLRRRSAAQSRQERDGRVKQQTHQIHIATHGKGLYEFTREIETWLRTEQVNTGLLTVFFQHTPASLVIQWNPDPAGRTA